MLIAYMTQNILYYQEIQSFEITTLLGYCYFEEAWLLVGKQLVGGTLN